MGNILLERIYAGRQKLQFVATELKKHFVGLDDIIDTIIKHVEVWYCLPEIIQRPTIVCLWGMTGVGKTDLIRRLTSLLEFTDRYLEVQLTTKEGIYSSAQRSLESFLDESGLESGKPGILLLDEIQRFRSVDDKGQEIYDYRFQDVWSLLSDGRFSSKIDAKAQILDVLYGAMYRMDQQEDEEVDDLEGAVKSANKKKLKRIVPRKYKIGYWEAGAVKRVLGLSEPLTEIMTWDQLRIIEETEKRLENKVAFHGKDYTKLLIFVSGNIDEAYAMSARVSDADMDADVFHEHSRRINFIQIKKALSTRFMPEQVARFGNTHVIYPSLSKKSYFEIVNRNIVEICARVKEYSGVDLVVDFSVNEVLYRNGVFPAQGVRPLFSTITSMFESALPKFVGKSLELEKEKIVLSYDSSRHEFVGEFGPEKLCVFNHGDLDKIRGKQGDEEIYPAAVHEAGHAVVYSLLLGLAPTQVAVALALDDDSGFTGIHDMSLTKNNSLDKICTLFAGTVAEKIVFGEGNESCGCREDIALATGVLSLLVRRCGMFDWSGLTFNPAACSGSPACNDSCYDESATSVLMEKVLKEQKQRAEVLLRDNKAFFDGVISELMKEKVLLPEDFVRVCEEFGVSVRIQSAEQVVRVRNKFRGLRSNKKIKSLTAANKRR